MPNMFSKHHDNFLETYLSTLEPRILNSERNLPGKNKLDYLVPLIALVKHVPSLIHGLQFVAQFKIQKTVNLVTYILVDVEGNIQNLTSTCISILSVNQKRVQKKKINITETIPDFFDRLKDYQTKNGSQCNVKDLRKKSKEFLANIQVTDVTFRIVGHQGYYVKIEKQKLNTQSNIVDQGVGLLNTGNLNTLKSGRRNLLKHFQVKYDVINKKYLGEICEGPPLYDLDEVDQNQSHILVTHGDSIQSYIADQIIDSKVVEEKFDIEDLKHIFSFQLNNLNIFTQYLFTQKNQNILKIIHLFYLTFIQLQNIKFIILFTKLSNEIFRKYRILIQVNIQQQINLKIKNPINFIQFKLGPKLGFGIKTVRLIDGQIREIEEKKDDEEDDENSDDEAKANQVQKGSEEDDQEENKELGNIFKNRINFIQFTSSNQFLYSNAMKQLRYISYILIIVLCGMCLVNISQIQIKETSYSQLINIFQKKLNHFLTSSSFDECKTRYDLLSSNNQMISEGQRILMKITQITTLNENIIQVNNKNTYFTTLQSDLSKSYDTMSELQTELSQVKLDFISQHSKLINDNIISIKSMNEQGNLKEDKYNYNDVTRQILSVINTLKSSPIEVFKLSDQDVFKAQFRRIFKLSPTILSKVKSILANQIKMFINEKFLISIQNFIFIYNLLNEYYMAQTQISDFFVEELIDWSKNKGKLFMILLIISVVIIILLFFLILPFYFWVTKSQREILTIFLEISIPKVKKLFQKCENFVNQMQSGNDEEMNSDNSLQSNHGDEDQKLLRSQGKKRRKFKILFKNRNNFFVPFILCILFFEAYFIATYFVSTQLATNVEQFVQEMNSTSMSERYYYYALNVQIMLLIDDTFPVNTIKSSDYLKIAINGMYSLNSDVQRQHSQNINELDKSYVSTYQDIMFSNATCDILIKAKIESTTSCEQFAEKSIMQGLSIALPRYIELFRYVTSVYEENSKKYTDKKQLQLETRKLINSTQISEMYTMQDSYIRGLYQQLVTVFLTSLQSILDLSTGTRITLLIISLIVQALLYLFFWLPILSSLSKEVVRIRSMITMIPLEICQQTSSIRQLILNYANQKQQDA